MAGFQSRPSWLVLRPAVRVLAGLSRRSARAANEQSRRTLPTPAGHSAEDHLRTSHAFRRHADGPPHDDPRDGQATRTTRARGLLSSGRACRKVSRRPAAIHLCRTGHGGLIGASKGCCLAGLRVYFRADKTCRCDAWRRCRAVSCLALRRAAALNRCAASWHPRTNCLRSVKDAPPCAPVSSPHSPQLRSAGLAKSSGSGTKLIPA